LTVQSKDSVEREFALIKHWRKGNIRPPGGGSVPGRLDECIAISFGSLDNFKKKFTATAVAGRGTVLTQLVWSPYFKELESLQIGNGQDPAQWGVIPLFTMNKRTPWLEAWWEFVDWEDVRRKFKDIVKK